MRDISSMQRVVDTFERLCWDFRHRPHSIAQDRQIDGLFFLGCKNILNGLVRLAQEEGVGCPVLESIAVELPVFDEQHRELITFNSNASGLSDHTLLDVSISGLRKTIDDLRISNVIDIPWLVSLAADAVLDVMRVVGWDMTVAVDDIVRRSSVSGHARESWSSARRRKGWYAPTCSRSPDYGVPNVVTGRGWEDAPRRDHYKPTPGYEYGIGEGAIYRGYIHSAYKVYCKLVRRRNIC